MLESDRLSEDEKNVVLDGLTKLSRVFDGDWLRQARRQHHPLLGYLLNKAPWSQLWLAEFRKKVEACKGLPKFVRLEKRLRNDKEYAGAEGEVEIVAKLIAAGIIDIELHPTVTVEGKPKEPDLRATVDGEGIYFEITALGESEDSVKARETHQELAFPLFDPEIVRFYRIHKILSNRRMPNIK